MFDNPRLIIDSSRPPAPGNVVWRSPSNIAILKYWGKHGRQLPRNPSVSLTLAASVTDTAVEYTYKDHPNTGEIDLQFFFHEDENEPFRRRILHFLESILPIFPFLPQLQLVIRSGNSFPHSAGIASSASAMSALALCLCTLEDVLFGTLSDQAEFDRKASYVARLGSGSACRSIFPHAALWGANTLVPGASDEYAIPIGDMLHPVFKGLHDDILIVSADEKSVSSTAGHALMDGNPYAEPRYLQARQRLADLLVSLQKGDLEHFGRICEAEALTLHALMLCSNPPYLLMRPNSLEIMERVKTYRADTGHPVFFTLDAGPNVHLLYPENIVAEVRGFIEQELRPLCENHFVMNDWVGEGPEEI
ncbi:MAG: diphosphomevalonate decarboxylase [Saprospiraceae bacterium]|nr:diphosphomevalonate decarboxylase [Saprospiraceae bacterium]